MLWYIRESSTAVYVSNLPMLWPLFRRAFKFGTFAGSSNKYQEHCDSQPLSVLSKKKVTVTSYTGSEEEINRETPQLEIEQRISFTVESSISEEMPRKLGYDLEAFETSVTSKE